MLLSLSQWLLALYPDEFSFLRVFQYITFRAVMAAMTALLIGLAFGPWVIRRLTALTAEPTMTTWRPTDRALPRGDTRRRSGCVEHRAA